MSVRRRTALTFAVGALGLALVAQLAIALHPRPKSATPLRVSLVPAFEKCTEPNNTHGPPLGFASCSPPVQTSKYLTVGTPDVNGAAANSVGFARFRVLPGNPGPPEDADIDIRVEITDVRCQTGVSACGGANTAGGPDYTGELEGFATARVTDHFNGPDGNEAATVRDIPFPFVAACFSTADTSIGSTCRIPTSTECLGCPPPKEGVRTVIQMTQVQVRDGGADGQVATDDNTLFLVQGVFLP